MKNIAINVKNLSKYYQVNKELFTVIKQKLCNIEEEQKYWALRNINFSIPRGEVVGILGRNGAGKSTLLKILASTLPKSSGEIKIDGKISAILELGTGFHPDYSGRENIMMGGMCLGMSKTEILSKIDEIIEFSELKDVIDRPFRTYSSGMQGRLTFSTAMSIKPDIFIVDEALATGDALFQEKCMTRIKDICASGSTVLLVTHSLSHIYEVCTSCMLIHQGELLKYGTTKEVGRLYEQILNQDRSKTITKIFIPSATESNNNSLIETELNAPPPLVVSEEVSLLIAELVNAKGDPIVSLVLGEEYIVKLKVKIHRSIKQLNLGFQILRETGLALTGDTTFENQHFIESVSGEVIDVEFRFKWQFISGTYLLRVGVTEIIGNNAYTPYIDHRVDKIFISSGKNLNGLVDPQSQIKIRRLLASNINNKNITN